MGISRLIISGMIAFLEIVKQGGLPRVGVIARSFALGDLIFIYHQKSAFGSYFVESEVVPSVRRTLVEGDILLQGRYPFAPRARSLEKKASHMWKNMKVYSHSRSANNKWRVSTSKQNASTMKSSTPYWLGARWILIIYESTDSRLRGKDLKNSDPRNLYLWFIDLENIFVENLILSTSPFHVTHYYISVFPESFRC